MAEQEICRPSGRPERKTLISEGESRRNPYETGSAWKPVMRMECNGMSRFGEKSIGEGVRVWRLLYICRDTCFFFSITQWPKPFVRRDSFPFVLLCTDSGTITFILFYANSPSYPTKSAASGCGRGSAGPEVPSKVMAKDK